MKGTKVVTIRTYRPGGIGDCFLLSFPKGKNETLHVLIDCGVLLGTESKEEKLRAIASDILEVTKGKLDILIATHEHYDHLSGFKHAREIFDRLEIGEVWLSWAENVNDTFVKHLKSRTKTSQQALDQTLSLLEKTTQNAQAFSLKSNLLPLNDFGFSTVGEQLDYLKKRPKSDLRYLEPGIVFDLPGTDDFKIYVLGPPKDLALLTRSNPSKRNSEVYELRLSKMGAFLGRVIPGELSKDEENYLANYPFDSHLGHPLDTDTDRQEIKNILNLYISEDWRTIDTDWLNAVQELALKIDDDVNNTSLVLAVEHKESGKVLLFPGDAQVGNWLSWELYSFGPRHNQKKVKDLLEQTVFYKVGHHGSHNATLQARGLELMTHPELVAVITVDEAQASRQGKSGWKMPFGPLYTRLLEKTQSRLLRTDSGLPEKPSSVSKQVWKAFEKRLTVENLFIDYKVELDP